MEKSYMGFLKSLTIGGALLVLTGCAGSSQAEKPTGVVDAARCERLMTQYRRYANNVSQQQRPGNGYYEIGAARCASGNYQEGVLYLQRAVWATGFMPTE